MGMDLQDEQVQEICGQIDANVAGMVFDPLAMTRFTRLIWKAGLEGIVVPPHPPDVELDVVVRPPGRPPLWHDKSPDSGAM